MHAIELFFQTQTSREISEFASWHQRISIYLIFFFTRAKCVRVRNINVGSNHHLRARTRVVPSTNFTIVTNSLRVVITEGAWRAHTHTHTNNRRQYNTLVIWCWCINAFKTRNCLFVLLKNGRWFPNAIVRYYWI